MLFRRTVTVLPLVISLAAGAAPKPQAIPAFKDGLDAMAARLWDLAATRFETALTTPELDAEGRQAILLRLAETRVRAGDAAGALKILADPVLIANPELPFWKAQALAASGRLGEAVALLDAKATAPGAPNRREALFTRAILQESIGELAGALEALGILAKERDAATVLRAKMDAAAILLDQGKSDEALTMLPPPNPKMTAWEMARADILRARAHLGKKENQAAIGIFSAVLQNEDDAYRIYRQDAAAGLAEAQLASGSREAAIDGLLAFIEQERDAPRFGRVFSLLLDCLPPAPALDDIILTRLREWCPLPALSIPPAGIATGFGSAASSTSSGVWPAATPPPDELATQALFHLAAGLRREGSPESKNGARRLLARLRLEYPAHPLAERALLESIRWDLADGRKEQAAAALATLEGSSMAPALRAEASLAAASTAFAAGDLALASAELQKAAALLDGDALRGATLNSAVIRLAAGDLPGFESLAKGPGKDPRIADDLALERALYLTSKRDPSAISVLDRFILDHPQHPRLGEARLAAAHAALDASPPDLVFAKAQLDSVAAEQTPSLPPAALAMARVRLAASEKRWADAAALADEFLKAYPADPQANAMRFELGNARFETKDYNQARLALEQLATARPDDPQASAALFLAARAAALGGTSQAWEESLALYDKLIAADGPLAAVSRLEKARVQITLKQFAAAAEGLDPWFRSMKKDNPLRITTGLLLGDALYLSPGSDPVKLTQILALFESLLDEFPSTSSRRFEIEYRRGLVLEKLPKTEETASKALEVYYSVLQEAAKAPPADWQWVDKCGVNARSLLEKQEKWESAIGVAQKHAMLASPGAKEAADRATALKQEHFIWDK